MLDLINTHSRDCRIVFDEEPHIYYVDGKPIQISVTTLVHEFFSKFDADLIISKMMNGKNWNKSKYFGMTPATIKKQWTDAGSDATHHGTIMHKAIESFYNNEQVNDINHVNTPEYKQFEKFDVDHKTKLKAYRTEWVVYNEDYNLAGSIDMVFENLDDGTFSIYDWKRSKEIKTTNYFAKGIGLMRSFPDCNYVHYSLQLNIYKHILEKKYGKFVRDMFLVVMHPTMKTYMKYEVLDLQMEVGQIFEEREKSLLKESN
jgi:ATP-dependent exoDNAse (exonuclease V) beta subunit